MNKEPLTEEFAFPSGIISQKKIFEHLYGKEKNVRSKSDLKPSAQNSVMYARRNNWEQIYQSVKTAQSKMFKEFRKLYYFTEVMISGACRVSEVLDIRPYDITFTGLVNIHSLKHGKDRTISPGNAKDYLLYCRNNQLYPFQGFNRFYVYREFKRFGMPAIPTGAGKNAVTHIFRHLQVAAIKENGNDRELIANYLGHRSLKSQKNYGR